MDFVRIDEPSPEVSVATPEDASVPLSKLANGRPLVLIFLRHFG